MRRENGAPAARRRRLMRAMNVSRLLITSGVMRVAIGLLWPVISKLGLGRLPGDIVIRRDHGVFYAPITTCLIVSLILSLIVWIFTR
jgi:Protein of unknown function (DUF2905)